MDLRGGPPLKQQQDFEIQGFCVPSTPAKTIETRRPLEFSPSYSQRSEPSEGCYWLDSAERVSTVIQDATPLQGHPLHNGSYSTSGISDFLRVLTGSQAAEESSACQATSGSSFMPHEPNTGCGDVSLMDPWSQKVCVNGFHASNDAGVSKILSFVPFFAPNGHGQEMPASQNNLQLNGKVLLTGSFCSSSIGSNCSIWPGQKVQYEPTDDCLPNLNSFPEIIISSAETLTMPNSQTPVAAAKNSQRIQDIQPSLKAIDLVDEGESEDNLQRKGSGSSHMALDNPADASFSNLMASVQSSSFKNPESANNMTVLSYEFSDQLVGNGKSITERENEAIDLNDASRQKPKRRKHRPKVIKEGKSSRTPKLVTPMPKTPKPTGDEPRAKRKYVRRKDTTPSPETTLKALRNSVEPGSRSQAKPVRRNLNFDLEEAQTIGKHSLLMSYFMQRIENHAQETCMDASLTSPRLKETVDSTKLQGPVVENSLAGIVFTLNNSTNLLQNEYLKILQTPVTSSMGNQNVRASNDNVNSNSISDAAIKGAIRDHCDIFNASAASKRNLVHSHNVANCASESHDAGKQGSCFSESCKRMKKRKGYGGATPNPSLELIYTPSTGWKTIQASNNSQDFTFSSAQAFMAEEKLQTSKCKLSCEKADGYIHSHHSLGNNDLTSSSRFTDSNMNSSPVKLCMQKNMGISQPSTPDKPSGYSNSQESKNCGTLVQLEKSEDVNKPVKTKGKRGRKKREENPLINPLPSSRIVGDSPKQTSPVITSTLSTYLHGENLLLEVNSVNQDTINYNVSTNIRLSSGPLVPYMNPVDDIVQKLSQLSINRDHEVAISQEPSALVPYVGTGGMMVPYKDLSRRRRPRSKVDLDPETNRVWKLLMGKECEEDGANADKEKWWEEERRVFQGRVESFIARMHLVQGDRRFSQWKGSVVDSVIGVFLTQNVSDHLSSSAFMALAARFPLQSRGNSRFSNAEKLSTTTDNHSFCCQDSLEVNAAENEGKEENCSSNETLGIGIGSSSVDYFKEKNLELHDSEASFCHGSPNIESGTEVRATRSVSTVEVEDRRLEEVVSSQNFVVPFQDSMGCQVHSVDHIRSNSFFNIEAEDLSTGSINNGFVSSSFTKLMQIAESSKFQKLFSPGVGRILTTESSSVNNQITPEIGSNLPSLYQLDNSEGTCQSHKTDSTHQHAQVGFLNMLPGTHLCHFPNPSNLASMENNANTLKEEIKPNLPSTICETISGTKIEALYHESTESKPENLADLGSLNKLLSTSRTACTIDSYLLIGTQSKQNVTFSETKLGTSQYSFSPKNLAERTNASSNSENSHECSVLQPQDKARFQQKDENSISKDESSKDAFRVQDQMVHSKITSASDRISQNRLDMVETFGSNMKEAAYNFQKVSSETPKEGERVSRKRAETEKKTYDWNSLRKEVYHNKTAIERSSDTMDSLDWEAVRCAPVSEIAETIRERGMNNVLAERIKEFLNRLVREHGSIDLEWLRDIPPDKSKDYLLSIRGLGLKSTECVRLLTLHHLAFPVDTNVGRICVRLGWVPLQPLPESLQLHLLELYPVLETIQKYLWPRLCKLDQRTLYELHYQMITFGKVFCTKSKPNCNACPMRGECRHFASAFASARLALPAPEDKSIVCSTYPIASENGTVFPSTTIPQIECGSLSQELRVQKNCEPIIEEPATPEPECRDALESAIEDAFFEDPDEIPTIKLNLEKFTQNLQDYMQEKMELQDVDMSKALVALTPEAASIPMPKLKNVSRLRTEHQVYEIPDSHPLLEGLDTREPDDPCPYLLAIWTPGETAQSTELPKGCCNSEGTSQPCDRSTCFACNSLRESQAHKVRGTLLIPCRTAMKGSFPLNGTYFQVNEVFADHHSSRNPIDVPRDWIWNLPRRMVCFGTSIPTIFRGLSTEGIQQCFWRGFVCVRGFDRVTRAPKPLYARLHFPASKAPRSRKGATATARAEELAKGTSDQAGIYHSLRMDH